MAVKLVVGGDRRRRSGVGRQLREAPFGQRHDVADRLGRCVDGMRVIVGLGKLAGRDTTKRGERVDVAFQEGFRPTGGENPVDALA